MGKRKFLPFIPVQNPDKAAEFAGMQNQFVEAPCNHSRLYYIFRDTIFRLLYSNFKWYNITEQEARMIEFMLINNGRICAVKTEFNMDERTPDGVFFGMFGTDVDGITYDFYGNPEKASCSGYNGKIFKANDTDHFVLGFDTKAVFQSNMYVRTLVNYVDNLAEELDRSYSAWKVAAETRKCGMAFNCKSERSAKLLRRTLKELSENNPYVVVNGEINDDIEVMFSPNNTDGLSEFHMNFMNCWGFVMDLLGLENNSQNKRERLVVTEAEMNRSLSRDLGADRLAARKVFAEECNKKFGTDIKVENYLASMVTELPNEANEYGVQNVVEGEKNDVRVTEEIRRQRGF